MNILVILLLLLREMLKIKMAKVRKKTVPIPSAISNYNRFMNGEDRSDQMINFLQYPSSDKEVLEDTSFSFH